MEVPLLQADKSRKVLLEKLRATVKVRAAAPAQLVL